MSENHTFELNYTVSYESTTSPFLISTNVENTSSPSCLRILYEDFGTSRVRIWDVALFVPNVFFLLFMMYRIKKVWHKILSGIGSGGSPIFITYFTLITLSGILNVIRGVVSMTVDVTSLSGSDANKILWVVLRFFLLMAEMSVLVFGIAFGHMDSKTSVKWVLFITTCIALVYSIVQCTLELINYDPRFQIDGTNWKVYGHGGTMFCFITSLIFLVMYSVVVVLPFVKWLKKYLSVPTKRSFYVYVSIMILLNLISVIGCSLLLDNNSFGFCMLDGFSLIYFTMFAPLMYWTFLSPYFGRTQPNSMLFSYSTHIDDGLPDVADYDLPTSGITVDSTLSGILVFENGRNESYQIANGHIEEQLHNFSNVGTDSGVRIAPTPDSTHSFIQPINV